MLSSLTQSIKQVWGMVFEYVEVLSGKTAAKAAEKGTEKYLTKKTGKEFENVATKGMNYIQPGLGTAAKVVDKTSKVVKAVSALSK
jgi:pyruvoyl-dependent arginine decarboxylase (PvlArgDC)